VKEDPSIIMNPGLPFKVSIIYKPQDLLVRKIGYSNYNGAMVGARSLMRTLGSAYFCFYIDGEGKHAEMGVGCVLPTNGEPK
jgi:hypothetical protein